jgi:hypothetical protein
MDRIALADIHPCCLATVSRTESTPSGFAEESAFLAEHGRGL